MENKMRENFRSDDVVYVAVNQDVGESESTLLWIMKNLQFKKIVLLHVHVPSSLTTSSCSLQQSEINAVQESEVETSYRSLYKYRDICTNNKVNKEDVNIACIPGFDVDKGIVKLIYDYNVKKLVMGAAADSHYSRKMSITSRKAKYVSEHAPRGCKMWFICKGKLITTKEGSVDLVNPPDSFSEFSSSEGRGKGRKNIYKEGPGNSRSSKSTTGSTPSPPHEFLCPITMEIMRDPQLAADGHTYEAKAFREHIRRGSKNSPMTNSPLDHCNLTPNRTLATMIKEWLEKHPNYKD